MEETRQFSLQETVDLLNSRITSLEEAVLSQKFRSDVHKAFLATLVVTIDNPERLQQVWEVASSSYEEMAIAEFKSPLDKTHEENFRGYIRDSLNSWSEVVNEAVKLRES